MTSKLELLAAKQRKLELLKKREELKVKLPHIYAHKHFEWSRKFHDSTNRVNLLCAANQIGKSTAAIRRHIDNATDKERWKIMWKTEPKMFWYFYPDSKTLEREWNTKWKPLMPDQVDEEHGWKVHMDGRVPVSIEWKSGVWTYFMFYSKAASSLQAGTVHEVTADEEMPVELWDELMLRLTRTQGIMNCVFTPTLNQPYWQKAIETNEVLKDAFKLQVSMYDCLKYEDASPNPTLTEATIQEVIKKCSSETEVLRRVFGKFVTEVGRTFFAFNFDKNLKPLENYEKKLVYAAVDYGSGGESGHPSAIVFVAVDPEFKQGQVIRAWRGDGIQTTAGDVYDKYREMSKDLKIVQACYDPAAADFGTIAERNGLAFTKANKARSDGEKILNTLFRYQMLSLAEEDGEISKLGSELSHIMDTNARSKSSKKHDDLADALRYLCMMIPWNFSELAEKFEERVVLETRPLTEAEYQVQQIKDRRGLSDGDKDEWQEFNEEFSHWNEEYGN